MGKLTDGPGKLDAEHFLPNDGFIRFIHDVIARHVRNCPGLIAEAQGQGNGSVYMIDPRTPTPHGEVPPEDILGAVEVQDGNMVAYHANPNFQIFTANGLMFLSSWWQERLVEETGRILEENA